MTRILIFGITGMLGHKLFGCFSDLDGYETYGTVREHDRLGKKISPLIHERIMSGVDVFNFDLVRATISKVQPDQIINCIGIIKQLPDANDPIKSISINALFPHKLAQACREQDVRLIHISTDCVFSGSKGNYTEKDTSDAEDLYGRTKHLGEVTGANCITLRTSIIGHELNTKLGLMEWFLTQKENIKGFTKAIYSGFPTVEMARIISKFVIPNPNLSGLYHVSSNPISKYHLLKLAANMYKKDIEIVPHDEFECDRSLDSTRFRQATGYIPPEWPDLIDRLYTDHMIDKKH